MRYSRNRGDSLDTMFGRSRHGGRDDFTQERSAGIGDEQEQTFEFRGLSKLRAVTSTVLEAIGEKYLTDHLPLSVAHDPEANAEFPFIDVEQDRNGAAEQETERIKCSTALDPQRRQVEFGPQVLKAKNEKVGALD